MDKAVCEINRKEYSTIKSKKLDTRYPSRHQHVLVIIGGQVHISSCFENKDVPVVFSLLSCNSFDFLWVKRLPQKK